MRVKIRGGTVEHGQPSLCVTCRYSFQIQGLSLNDRIMQCRATHPSRAVPFAVTSCSGYSDARQPTLYAMEEMAWVLRSDPSRHKIGFVEARKLKDEDRHVLEEG